MQSFQRDFENLNPILLKLANIKPEFLKQHVILFFKSFEK